MGLRAWWHRRRALSAPYKAPPLPTHFANGEWVYPEVEEPPDWVKVDGLLGPRPDLSETERGLQELRDRLRPRHEGRDGYSVSLAPVPPWVVADIGMGVKNLPQIEPGTIIMRREGADLVALVRQEDGIHPDCDVEQHTVKNGAGGVVRLDYEHSSSCLRCERLREANRLPY